MTNKYYNYENIDLWYNDKWDEKISYMNGLAQWMGANKKTNHNEYTLPVDPDPFNSPNFMAKTQSYDDPAVIKYWADKGVRLSVLAQAGKRWVALAPEKAYQERTTKLPTLVVFHKEDFSDPYWAMRTVEYYKEYNEMLAASQDMVIVYLVSEGPDTDRIYLNIMQEAFILFPSDLTKIYIDVGYVYEVGEKLSNIPDFRYFNEKFEPANPDEYVEEFGSLKIKAINVGNRWGNRDSLTRGLVMNYLRNEGTCDKEWLIHTEMGKKLMDGIALEYKYDTIYDEGILKYWADKGLTVESHEKRGERWVAMIPTAALDEGNAEKLPVMLALQEVYPGNEHLAVTAEGYFHEMCEIAAQGECIVLFFVLEDPDSNDLFIDILDDAEKMYPIDPSRVYATGHSHDGGFARIFTFRHPERIAALATLGNDVGLASFAETGNPVGGTEDSDIEALSKMEVPVINLRGLKEIPYPSTEEGLQRFVKQYQRRLAVMNCPPKSAEEILAAHTSADKAERMVGVPADKSEVVWMYGCEHYVVDVKNNAGQYHLRFVHSENMPHTTTPAMFDMAWSFVRRFAKDLDTGKCIELY